MATTREHSTTSELADFIERQHEAIVARFTDRVASTLDHRLTRGEIVDQLPLLLDELAHSLRVATSPTREVFAISATAQAHGGQRLRIGYDVESLVREYGLLRDCVYQLLEEAGRTPPLHELRLLADRLSAAVADSVGRYVAEHQRDSEAERRMLLGLFEQAPSFLCYLHGPDLVFELANAAFFRLFGRREIIGRPARGAMPDIEGQGFFTLLDAAVAGRRPFVGRAMRTLVRREAEAPTVEAFVDVVVQPIVGTDGALEGVLVQGHDVTEVRRAEAERERLLGLERTARAAAEDASRLRDEFLATVSHELRTPLSAILGWAQMLQTTGLAPEKRDRGVEAIERNARAQAQLIEDLLDVSRILAGKLRLEVEAIDVGATIEAALETVRPAADAKGIRLRCALASPATVMGDPHRLQQVVWNLLSNAVKFTPRRGRVQVLLGRRESEVEITVTDSGQGIAPDFLPHVFERFRQAEGGSNRSHGGLGLGLSIVRHLVELHGGSVAVASDGVGRGATFTVRLPVAALRGRDATDAVGGPDPRRSIEGLGYPLDLGGLRVLVVDDEADSRDLLRAVLEGCGASVATAASTAEALRRFDETSPAVVVSDVGMPGEDGYALIDKIRSRPLRRGGGVPAVALTAYARAEDRTRALIAGFDSHVTKPVEPMELLVVIAALTGRARPRGE